PLLPLFLLIAGAAVLLLRRKWQPSRTAFGFAAWATAEFLRRAGMLGSDGLILGRTLGGQVIRLPHFCHGLLVGTPGAGKAVSVLIPQLLTYVRGSIICFSVKSDLFDVASERRRA